MEKEIEEQVSVLENLIKKYIVNYCILVNFPSKFSKIKFIASGSSMNCSRIGAKFFADIADYDVDIEYSSEFLALKNYRVKDDTIYFFVSQSGETVDTLAAMDIVKKNGGTTFALVNDKNSKMSKMADFSFDIEAGLENAIAATKSFSASVFAIWLCALKAAQSKSINISNYIENIEKLPSALEDIIKNPKQIETAAGFISKYKSFPIVGYNYYYALAKEGALKVKETSYIDSNAYSLGEFLHGHVALLNEKKPIIEIFTDDLGTFEKKNLNKIQVQYNPKTLVITDVKNYTEADCAIVFPKYNQDIYKYMTIIVILQLLAFNTALKLKRDIDSPKGLQKVISA